MLQLNQKQADPKVDSGTGSRRNEVHEFHGKIMRKAPTNIMRWGRKNRLGPMLCEGVSE